MRSNDPDSEYARQSFERLFDTHEGRVRAYALRRLAIAADAEDVVSETFAVAWRRLDQVPDEPIGWLLATARKLVANHNRGERRRTALRETIAGQPAAQAGPDRGLMEALAMLSEKDREALLLVAWESLTHAQAGRVCGCSTAAFSARHHRARRRLARALAALEERPGEPAPAPTGQG